ALYIANHAKDKAVAKRFVNALRDECSRLERYPAVGSVPKDHLLRSLGYRFLIHKDHLIFYSTDEEKKKVDVLAIFNTKKDYMRVIRRFI
ncbi:MAG: type II toxin-antitoxin system RelE/ParE family toxin, partial [Lachnospiraceae bacterium]|nr:type II toxin-antitoxin system RelE/ParE family toxin [Candidatus Equihabitans merdae]